MSAMTPLLATLYGPAAAPAMRPETDEVVLMWPPCSDCWMSGLKDLRAIDRPPQVDPECPFPIVHRDVEELRKHRSSGVVAQYVDAFVGVHRRVGHRLHIVKFRDIGLHADRVVSGGSQLRGGCLDAIQRRYPPSPPPFRLR